MAAAKARGAFLLFEGVDRCGKTTQAKMLVDALNAAGQKTVFMRFPDRETTIGGMIDAYLSNKAELDDRAIHLLFAANRWERRKLILDALAEGTHIVMDRYAFSGVAFSSAKPGLDLEWCKAPDAGLPMPDVIMFMDLSIEDAAKRGEFGKERYESTSFQTIVKQRFEVLRKEVEAATVAGDASASAGASTAAAAAAGGAAATASSTSAAASTAAAGSSASGGGTWVQVNAAGTIEGIHAHIRGIADATIAKAAGAPIRRLWDGAPLA